MANYIIKYMTPENKDIKTKEMIFDVLKEYGIPKISIQEAEKCLR